VHDERVRVVGQTLGRGGVAGSVELACEGLQSLLCIALVGGVGECLPVGATDAFALAFGELGELVADAVNTAVLAV
jgi:ethanolamine utilization protein EutA (predicted chaperonin)